MSQIKRSPQISKISPLLVTGLMVAGNFQFIPQVLALGTPANTEIKNQATASYQDPQGQNINAVSNTVSVIVSPIAGVTVVPDKIVDQDGNAVEAGDVVSYYFTVTNIGNYENVIRIPTEVDIAGLDADGDGAPDALLDTTATLGGDNGITILFDKDENGSIDYTDTNTNGTWDPGETGPEVWIYNAAQGDYYNGATKWDNASELIEPDESFTVIVTAQAPSDGTIGAGDPLTVTLGDTISSPTDFTAGQQNVPYIADTTGDNDVFTVNDFNDNGTENDADFVNGQREAGASQTVPYAASVNPLALAAVKKSGVYTPNDVSTYADDTIEYTLDLEVQDVDPTNLFQPASLSGIQINLNGASTNRIIVSDRLPVDADGQLSVLQSVSTNLPAGWTVVYTTDDTAPNNSPTTARWWSSFGTGAGQPANLAAVKRIGFVYNGSLAAGYQTEAQVGSLSFTVALSNATSTSNSLAVYNIAQVVGTTQGDDPANPTNPIYDESGDDRPNNYSDDGTPPNPDGSDYDPNTDTGLPSNEDTNGTSGLQPDELDSNNDNTGTDTDPTSGDGEPNLITAIRATQDNILIGPSGVPEAVGPNGTQDTDFTNASGGAFTPSDTNSDGIFDDFNPSEIVITNTIKNPNTTGFIANVTVEPADIALVNTTTTGSATNGDIPDGTVVRLTFGSTTVYYEYDSATGTWSGPFSDAGLTNATTPLVVDTQLVAGESQAVTVGINLPSIAGVTPTTLPSYPINLVVFPEDDLANTPGYTGETTYNLTIDRLYPAGYVELSKSARIYTYDQDTGLLSSTPTAYSTDPDAYNTSVGDIRPGDVIEYRIIYTNISETGTGGVGNVLLPASSFVLTEDGTTATNNWATYSLHQFGTNTGADVGDPPYRGTVTYDSSNTEPSDDSAVDVYQNSVPTLSPGQAGTFTFLRELN